MKISRKEQHMEKIKSTAAGQRKGKKRKTSLLYPEHSRGGKEQGNKGKEQMILSRLGTAT